MQNHRSSTHQNPQKTVSRKSFRTRLLCAALSVLLLLAAPLALSSCAKKPVLGILQFGTHESLNNCYRGILDGLAAGGTDVSAYDVRYLNANFDGDLAATQASTLVNLGAKVIIAIATPTAIAAANASLGNVPVVFCAVTDEGAMKDYSAVCGASDRPNYQQTLALVTAFMGREDLNIAVISHTTESSDAVMISDLRAAAAAYAGMDIRVRYISEVATIATVTESMIDDGADCFLNLLDNTVVGQLDSILAVTDAYGIPVFGSEIEQVKAGCLAASSIDYNEVGSIAGGMAAAILANEAAPEALGCRVVSSPTPCYSPAVAQKLGISVPNMVGLVAVEP